MTTPQILSVGILIGAMVLLAWGRWRYDLVAAVALLAGVAAGVIPMADAFVGFADQITITVGSALVVSAALGRSGVMDALLRPLRPVLRGPTMQIVVLGGLVAAASGFMKNIAALAVMMPVAVQLARKIGRGPGYILMPLSFAALLGGLVTLVGTSPNIVVSGIRAEITGQPFAMFDFAPVGLVLAGAGVFLLAVTWRLLPQRKGAGVDAQFALEDYRFEVRVPKDSPLVNRTVADFEKMAEAEAVVVALIREDYRRYVPAGHWLIYAEDILVLQGDAKALQGLLRTARLELDLDRHPEPQPTNTRTLSTVEAVVAPGSPMIGSSAEQLALRERHRVNLVAISRRGSPLRQRLRRVRFQPGDVVVLQGNTDALPDTLATLGCLPLAERNLPLGPQVAMAAPLIVLVVAVALVSFQMVSVPLGFFAAAVAMVVTGSISLREAYAAIDWPVLVLLAALIPVSDSLRATGATDMIAASLAMAARQLPVELAVGLTMLVAMAVTPFMNNAATVLVMAPIGAGVAQSLGLSVDPFLMAVAVGAACDFLTPIGHQCNTLVMGPGGYRFRDYWRLGFPLSLMVLTLGTFVIVEVWPVR